MIEGVAGCLKQGGQGHFRASKKALRTRRYLHSTFWSHGAGNIDLPAWWLFMLQARESSNVITSIRKKKSSAKKVAAGLHEMFLNFLYPLHTHALIQRLDRATLIHRQAAKLAQQSSRKYTSIAEDLLAGKTGSVQREQEEEGGASQDLEAEAKASTLQSKAEDLLNTLALPEDYDRLWAFHQEVIEASESLEASILERIFYSLSDSERVIDFERSLALFETIDRKNSRLYCRAVTTALKLEDFETAVHIHAEAVLRNPGSIDIGTQDLMTHAIRRDKWTLAIDTWYRFWQLPIVYFSLKDELWQQFNAWSMGRKMVSIRRAVFFASSKLRSAVSEKARGPPEETAMAARQFALAMADMALGVESTVRSDPDQYLTLLKEIKNLNGIGGGFYLQGLNHLLSSEDKRNHEVAFTIYSELRQEKSFAPSQRLLEQTFTLCRTLKEASGQLMVLEDWATFLPSVPPPSYFTVVSQALSTKRSIQGIETLLNLFFRMYRYCNITSGQKTQFLNSVLYFYRKCADNRTIVRKFDEFRSQYNFSPDADSYNHMIMTFAIRRDLKNTMSWFEDLKKSGLRLTHYSFHGPIVMFARLGDFDAVYDLLADLEKHGLKPDMVIVQAVTVVNLMNDRHEEAEKVVMKAMSLDLKRPATRLWNFLLAYHAKRGDLGKVSALQQQMSSAGVPENGFTYAFVMRCLCQSRSPDEAWLVMTNVMPRMKIKPTSFHYHILMEGFLSNAQLSKVFRVYRSMVADNCPPNFMCLRTLLQTANRSELEAKEGHNKGDTESLRPREVLDMIEEYQKQYPSVAQTPPSFREVGDPNPLDRTSFISGSYRDEIHHHIDKDSVDEIPNRYSTYVAKAVGSTAENITSITPADLLNNQFKTQIRTGTDEAVERCWSDIIENSKESCKRSTASLAEPGWVLYNMRLSMQRPLSKYLRYLTYRERFDDMTATVEHLNWCGFEITSSVWNTYVHHLIRSPFPRHKYLAFSTCERELMQDWPGWTALASNQTGFALNWYNVRKNLKRLNSRTENPRGLRLLRFKVLMSLAGVYKRAASGIFSVGEDEVSRKEFARVAPKLTEVIVDMPRVNRDMEHYLREKEKARRYVDDEEEEEEQEQEM